MTSLAHFTKTRRKVNKRKQGKNRKRLNRAKGSTAAFSIDPEGEK